MQPIPQTIGRSRPPRERPILGQADSSPKRRILKGTDIHSSLHATARRSASPKHEFRLLERRAAEEAVRTGEGLVDLEMVVALRDKELCGLAGRLDRRGEVARLALKFGRLERPVRDDHRAVEPVEVALRTQ